MKRTIVFAVVVALSLAVGAAQDTPKVIDVEQLEDNLFVLRGEGGGGNALDRDEHQSDSAHDR